MSKSGQAAARSVCRSFVLCVCSSPNAFNVAYFSGRQVNFYDPELCGVEQGGNAIKVQVRHDYTGDGVGGGVGCNGAHPPT